MIEWNETETKHFFATPANDIGPPQETDNLNRLDFQAMVSIKPKLGEGRASGGK